MIRSAKQLAELEHSYNSALTGAAARIGVDLAAQLVSRTVYDRLVEELTERGVVTVDYLMENGKTISALSRWKAAAGVFFASPPVR